MRRQIYLGPSPALSIGSGIARGINQGMQNFMMMRYRQQQMDAMRQRNSATQALNQAKAQAMQARYGDQVVDPQKIGALLWASNHPGSPIPTDIAKSLLKNQIKESFDKVQTPDQMHVLASNLASVVGSSPGRPDNSQNGDALGASPGTANPQMAQTMGVNPAPSSVYQAPDDGTQVDLSNIPMNFAERDIFNKAIGAQAMANRMVPIAEADKYKADQGLQGRLAEIEGNLKNANSKQEHDTLMKQADIEYKKWKDNLSSQTQIKIAGMRGSHSSAVSTRGSQDQQSVLKRINDLTTQYNNAAKPSNLGIAPLPDQVDAVRSPVKQSLNDAYDQYQKLTGRDLRPQWLKTQGAPGAQPNVVDYSKGVKYNPGDILRFNGGVMHQVLQDGSVDPKPYQAPASRTPQSVGTAMGSASPDPSQVPLQTPNPAPIQDTGQ